MTSVFAWTKLVLTTLLSLGSLTLMVLFYVFVWRLARMWFATLNPVLSRNTPSTGKYILRRMFCRHRGAVARIRDPYGRHYTACGRCGIDVNEGKAREEWR